MIGNISDKEGRGEVLKERRKVLKERRKVLKERGEQYAQCQGIRFLETSSDSINEVSGPQVH